MERGNVPEHFSYSSNDDGATWAGPAAIPDDGNQHLGGYMSFAVAPDGRGAFAGDVTGGNTQGMKCTWPKLARSSDWKAWATCAPQGNSGMDTRTLWGTSIFNPSGTLYLFFQNRAIAPQQALKPGLTIWGGK